MTNRTAPGVLPSMTRVFLARLPTLEITSVIRSASGIAKKLGLRTWGKLDRRIIMRGDRRVVIDLSDPKVISHGRGQDPGGFHREVAGREAIDDVELGEWSPREVGVLGPCLMEQVHPGFRVVPDDSRRPSPVRAAPALALTPVGRRDMSPKLARHPAFAAIGSDAHRRLPGPGRPEGSRDDRPTARASNVPRKEADGPRRYLE